MKENLIVQVIQLAFVEVKNIGFNNGGVEKLPYLSCQDPQLALCILRKLA